MWWNMRITQTLTYGLAIFSNISYNHDLTNVCSVFRCLNMWDLAPYKSNPIVGGKTKTLFMSSHVPRNVKCSCRWYFNSFILYNSKEKYSMLNNMKFCIWQSKLTFSEEWNLCLQKFRFCSIFNQIYNPWFTLVVTSWFVISKIQM